MTRITKKKVSAIGGAALLVVALGACGRDIRTGHVDALDVDYESSQLSLNLRDDTVSPPNDDTDPTAVRLIAAPGSKTTVPAGSQWSFLGPAGSDTWILPQTQNPNLLWPGWDTNGIPANQLQNNRITLRLVSMSGPGRVAVFTTNTLGAPTVVFNSNDGLPDDLVINRAIHAHGSWAFSAPGTYTLNFEARGTTAGGTAITSGVVPYTFVVEA